jgi:hypothetical protein
VRHDNGQPLILEGGGIETDGQGTMLVTEEWLLSDVQVRNPGYSREDYERAFHEYLGITKTIWLGEGCVGDDTHGHIDDIARFVAPGVVVLAHEEDERDENLVRSLDNLRRLQRAEDARGARLDVVTLPFPRAVVMDGKFLIRRCFGLAAAPGAGAAGAATSDSRMGFSPEARARILKSNSVVSTSTWPEPWCLANSARRASPDCRRTSTISGVGRSSRRRSLSSKVSIWWVSSATSVKPNVAAPPLTECAQRKMEFNSSSSAASMLICRSCCSMLSRFSPASSKKTW